MNPRFRLQLKNRAAWLRTIVVGMSVTVTIFAGLSQETKLPQEVIEFTTKYQKAIKSVNEPLSKLKSGYVTRITGLRNTLQKDGKLDQLLLIDKELTRVKTSLPGNDSKIPALAEIQNIYHKHYSLQAPRVFIEQQRVENAYTKGLEKIVADLTQKGDVEAAIEVNKLLAKSKERKSNLQRLSAAGVNGGDPFAYFDWKKLGEEIRSNRITETGHVGGAESSNQSTRDLPADPSVLVGFDFYHGPFGPSKDTVRRVVPLFRSEKDNLFEGVPRAAAKGDRRRRVLAKEGYVVAGVSTVSEAGVRKVKVEFRRLEGMKTVSEGKYESDWYGKWEGGREASLSTDGKLPVGLDGWVGRGTGEFWLLVVAPK